MYIIFTIQISSVLNVVHIWTIRHIYKQFIYVHDGPYTNNHIRVLVSIYKRLDIVYVYLRPYMNLRIYMVHICTVHIRVNPSIYNHPYMDEITLIMSIYVYFRSFMRVDIWTKLHYYNVSLFLFSTQIWCPFMDKNAHI